MIKALFNDGKETELEGVVIFYPNEYEALCRYNIRLNGYDEYDYSNFKLLYDTNSKTVVRFLDSSFGFFKEEDYDELYKESILEIKENSQ